MSRIGRIVCRVLGNAVQDAEKCLEREEQYAKCWKASRKGRVVFKVLENGWKRKNCRQSAGNVLDGINCVQCWKISEICKETEEQRAKC